MWAHRMTAIAVVLSLAIPAAPLAAQIDYHDLDRERPVATEDAYPVGRHAFEVLLPIRTEQERGGDRLHLLPLEIEYGVIDNAQIGLAIPFGALDRTSSEARWGLAGLTTSALYNFNTESPTLPAFPLGTPVARAAAGELVSTLRSPRSCLIKRSAIWRSSSVRANGSGWSATA